MTADKIIINGKMLSFDLKGYKKTYEAIALSGREILATGTTADIMALATSDTEIIDAEGNTVTSGMCDSHLHVSSTAELLYSLKIYHIDPENGESREAYIDRLLSVVKEYVEDNPDSPVIRATGWNPAVFTIMGGQPTCADLDRVCNDRPVLLRSYCHHFLWLNSKALEMTGITKDTKLGQGCIVEKDSDGNPTGIFVDIPATEMVLDSFELADFSAEEYKAGILNYQNEYAIKNGITSVFDAFLRPHAIQAYRELALEGQLKMRVRGAFLADPTKPAAQFDEMISNKGKFDVGDMFQINTVKFFFDGGEFTSLMNEPLSADLLKANGYDEDYLGPYIWYPEQAKEAFLKLSKAGFQIHIHVMGDGAAKEAMDTFAYVREQGVDGNRDTLTHVMLIDEDDMDRMAELGVIGAMQAQWATLDGFHENYVVPLLGGERALRVYPVGELLRRGVICSAATDFPIDFMYNSRVNIQIGMTRSVPKAHPEYEKFKGQSLGPAGDTHKYCATLDQMLTAYTTGGAYQLFLEEVTGDLATGKSADIVIFDGNFESAPIDDVESINVKQVIFMGETVYGG